MSNYFFTDKWGDISKKEYNDSDKISLKKSFEIFISNLRLKEEPIFNKIENTDATYEIDVFGTQIYACICRYRHWRFCSAEVDRPRTVKYPTHPGPLCRKH